MQKIKTANFFPVHSFHEQMLIFIFTDAMFTYVMNGFLFFNKFSPTLNTYFFNFCLLAHYFTSFLISCFSPLAIFMFSDTMFTFIMDRSHFFNKFSPTLNTYFFRSLLLMSHHFNPPLIIFHSM